MAIRDTRYQRLEYRSLWLFTEWRVTQLTVDDPCPFELDCYYDYWNDDTNGYDYRDEDPNVDVYWEEEFNEDWTTFPIQSGTTSFYVNKGDIFGFRAHSLFSVEGPAITDIWNFSAPAPASVPAPASLALIVLGLLSLGFFRKPEKQH